MSEPRRTARLEMRLRPEEAQAFAEAATREGLGVSAWARRVLLLAATEREKTPAAQ